MNPTLKRILMTSQNVITRGVFAYYEFKDMGGQVVTDKMGNWHGQNGTDAGVDVNDIALDGVKGSFGGADLVLCGAVNMPIKTLQMVFYTGSELSSASTMQTLCGLGYATTSGSGLIIGPITGGLTDELITFTGIVGTTRYGWCDGAARISIGWHTVDVVWDGSAYHMFYDGIERPLTGTGAYAVQTAKEIVLGAWHVDSGYSSYLKGYMGQALFGTESLSFTELAHNRKAFRAIMAKRGISIP